LLGKLPKFPRGESKKPGKEVASDSSEERRDSMLAKFKDEFVLTCDKKKEGGRKKLLGVGKGQKTVSFVEKRKRNQKKTD